MKPAEDLYATDFLTVCTGNICRSPMAEGILRGIFGCESEVAISSAGTHALLGNAPTEFAVIAARENGIDIKSHKARPLNRTLIGRSRVIFCMETSQVEWVLGMDVSASPRVFNLADFSGQRNLKQIQDPYGCSLRDFRQCFRDMDLCIRRFLDEAWPSILRTGVL